MNEKLGSKIAEGGCSEVFEWEDRSKLIKLAKMNTNYGAMKREYDNNCMAWNCGLSVAEPYEMVEVDGRPGIVFERIYGETLKERFFKQIMKQPADLDGSDIQITARILYEIHNKKIDIDLPSHQRDNIKHGINRVEYLTSVEKEAVITHLDSLPSKQTLCHGDPNPGNILITNDGKAVVIDWMDASIGNPEADLAEYIMMIRYAILPPHLPAIISTYFDSIRETAIQLFMDEYTQLSGITYRDVAPWFTPIAARKLSADAISEDEKAVLVEVIRNTIKESED